MADLDIARRARFALELGRLRWAFVRALPLAVAAGALAVIFQNGGGARPSITALVVLAVTACAGWKSRACLWGCAAGVVLGIVPFLAMKASGVLCSFGDVCVGTSSLWCAAGGLATGVGIAVLSRHALKPLDVVCGAAAGALIHVMVGCSGAGAFEAVGLVGGLVVGASPLAVLRRASAQT